MSSLWQQNPPRLAVVLSVLPAVFCLVCWLAARKMIRILEQSDDWGLRLEYFPDYQLNLIRYGWLLAVIPIVWGVAAALRADMEGGVASLRDRDALAGKVLAITVIVLALFTLLCAINITFGPPVGPMQPLDRL